MLSTLSTLCLLALGPGDIDADFDLMMTWFGGRFDNNQQVWLEGERELEADLVHEHIHSIFAPVELVAFEGRTFYVQQYMDGDPAKIYRQRLYAFSPDRERARIVLRIYAFPDAKAVVDAHKDPSKLNGLTPEALRATPGCEVYWRREGDHFNGSMTEGACRIKSRRSGKTLIITDDLYLDGDEIWIRDKATDNEGNYVFGHKGNEHHKLLKVREFKGWAVVKREEKDSEGKDQYLIIKDLRLHDQGQRVALVSEEGGALPYSVELAQLVYQKTKTAIMKLAIYEQGKDKAIAYTWTNPEAERIGINLRWIQVGMALDATP